MTKPSITNIQELKLSKSDLEQTVKNQEMQLVSSFEALKERLFTMETTEFDEGDSSALKEEVLPFIAKYLGSMLVSKWLKPKSKLISRAAIYFSSSIVQKLLANAGKGLLKKIQTLIAKT